MSKRFSILLLLLFTYQFVRQAASSMIPREEPSPICGDCSKRTLFNIIWGCVSTTVICAWSAIHPNIQPREGPFKAMLRRLESMVTAVVAPEILPGCAFNQLFAAVTIRDLYNEKRGYKTPGFWKGWKNIWETVMEWFSWNELQEDESEEWTLAHGFFVVMGGIRLVEPVEGNPVWVEAKTDDVLETEKGLAYGTTVKPRVTILTKEMLGILLDKGIEIKVTEDEIAKTAKGDVLSKTIFLLQSSWFIVHCITRAVEGLSLTQLELTTLALASLNGVTMILWWKKPLGAQTVVRVYLKDKLTDQERTGDIARTQGSNRLYIFSHLRNVFWSAVFAVRNAVLCRSPHGNWFLKLPLAIGLPLAVATLLLFPIVALVIYSVYTLGDVVLSGSISFHVDATHVPSFYAPKHSFSKYWHPFLMMILATGFGAIHCAGWNFNFPTSQEEKLWRVASLVVTIVPPFLFTILLIVKRLIKLLGVKYEYAERDITGLASLLFALMYVIARVVILGQAIALLRHQPPNTFTAVDWSGYYPHIL